MSPSISWRLGSFLGSGRLPVRPDPASPLLYDSKPSLQAVWNVFLRVLVAQIELIKSMAYPADHIGWPIVDLIKLDLDVDARRKLELHERVNRFVCRVHNVHQALVRADLVLVTSIFVDVW